MGVHTTNDWRDAGKSRSELDRALRTGQVTRLRRGVVAETDGATAWAVHRMKLEAAAPFLGPETCFGHESAAVLHQLPLLAKRLDQVVAVRGGGGHGEITPTLHTRRTQLPGCDATVVDGFPVTSLERTTADLIRRLPFPEAVMVADAALRAGADPNGLIARTLGGRGCRMAASVLAFADARAESAGESLSRVRLHRAGLDPDDLQAKLYNADGEFLGRVDFWWEEAGLAGEFDGMVKYGKLLRPGQSAEEVILAEKRREQLLLAAGFPTVRWTWPDLWDGQLEYRVRSALGRRIRR